MNFNLTTLYKKIDSLKDHFTRVHTHDRLILGISLNQYLKERADFLESILIHSGKNKELNIKTEAGRQYLCHKATKDEKYSDKLNEILINRTNEIIKSGKSVTFNSPKQESEIVEKYLEYLHIHALCKEESDIEWMRENLPTNLYQNHIVYIADLIEKHSPDIKFNNTDFGLNTVLIADIVTKKRHHKTDYTKKNEELDQEVHENLLSKILKDIKQEAERYRSEQNDLTL